ncbi:DinB family protein [Paenibacillus pasadenensis]|uniref:DinB family protein n=1 Tax=Paenibacillus pasadenensis TaxID=217090 RepID=UPI00203BDDB1|nr:DinB family protein [Paenibacillus pasadenensis]MCM3747704.1 DinB family protein [Paenibacillus pasadenensis]
MRQRPDLLVAPEFVIPYVKRVPDGDLIELLALQKAETIRLLGTLDEERAEFRYAPGKWSVVQVLGHITDNERIMSYRLLRIARGDKTELPGYDENLLVAEGPFDSWNMDAALADYAAVRNATLTLLRGLRPGDWERESVVNGASQSALLIASVLCGHELHHLHVLQERYGVGRSGQL